MRKKSFLFIFFVFLFGIFGLGLRANPTSFHPANSFAEKPALKKTKTQEISAFDLEEDVFVISGTDSEISIDYDGQTTKNSWSEVLEFVTENKGEKLPVLKFDGYETSTPLSLGGFDAVISGDITLAENEAVIQIQSAETETNITLRGLTISGKCENLVEVSGETACTIKLESDSGDLEAPTAIGNTFKEAEGGDVNFAIRFLTTGHTLFLQDEIVAENMNFTNFDTGVTIKADKKITTSGERLKITVPYWASGDVITFSGIESANGVPVTLVPEADFYTVTQTLNSGEVVSLKVRTTISLEYDFCGGQALSEPYENTLDFYLNFNFLSESEVSKDYSNFLGWVGKFYVSEALKTKYSITADYLYFDISRFTSFAEADFDLTQIENFFATSLDEIDTESSTFFESFEYDEASENLSTFLPFKFMLDNGQKISLVAIWEYKTYQIEFNSMGAETFAPVSKKYNEEILEGDLPTPSKEGYDFGGWYLDSDFQKKFELSNMPPENLTLFAKWNIQSFKLNYYVDGDYYTEQTFEFEQNITLIPSPRKAGFSFLGWFEDETLEQNFSLTVMPSHDVNAYGKFTKNLYSVIFVLYDNVTETKDVYYDEPVERPDTNPTRTGYYFIGWFTDTSFSREFDFSTHITTTTYIYANWGLEQYTITLNFNNFESPTILRYNFGDEITIPEPKAYKNHTFAGWFLDSSFENSFKLRQMPANNLTLYAKWNEKEVIVLNVEPQVYDYDSINPYFRFFSEISGFLVQYFVDGNWTTAVPVDAGTYDILITRGEDSHYASFEQLITGGFVIGYRPLNFTWLIVSLFLISVMEICAIILLKKMKRMKISKTLSLFPIIIGGNSILPTSQFVLLIVSGALALVGFIYLIYMIVNVHRTALNDSYLPSKLDNRERFKDELSFQNNNNGDDDYITVTKTNESFGNKYSTKDIEGFLVNDTFTKDIQKKREKFDGVDESSTNWNKTNGSDGSDVIGTAKQKNKVKENEAIKNPLVEFVDEDDQTNNEN